MLQIGWYKFPHLKPVCLLRRSALKGEATPNENRLLQQYPDEAAIDAEICL